ncbi:MAG: hypothetical protein COV09_01920 [Candidatus Vogelbacteria bacterium CG10_big_fil_rev_8_21_14_0_10_50_13]|uniref:PpiC domain-containing protein n=1 Tax=Candidatus Vogelbacteria bacterium CG10_big_fil_rev_8_21_14_0_10_50_13 TaxID=1975044 RepID=A0A2H0RFN0_9BACT|nr:MAG: hypothetical protein COV09_01920 [Candidatus Vogelbacteria bacterium CG10_big_fil_rev_8_21_14_0_10_50_13]
MKNTIIAVVAIIVLGAGAWYLISSGNLLPSGDKAASLSGPVAVVNGEEIAGADFVAIRDQIASGQGAEFSALNAEAQAAVQEQALEALISQILLRQAVVAANITVSAEEVAAQIEAVKSQFGGDEAALAEQGLVVSELTEKIRLDLATKAYFNQELNLAALTASEAEIAAAYEQMAAGAAGEEGKVPSLAEVSAQVEAFVIQQKQQELVIGLIDRLRQTAEIEILL